MVHIVSGSHTILHTAILDELNGLSMIEKDSSKINLRTPSHALQWTQPAWHLLKLLSLGSTPAFTEKYT